MKAHARRAGKFDAAPLEIARASPLHGGVRPLRASVRAATRRIRAASILLAAQGFGVSAPFHILLKAYNCFPSRAARAASVLRSPMPIEFNASSSQPAVRLIVGSSHLADGVARARRACYYPRRATFRNSSASSPPHPCGDVRSIVGRPPVEEASPSHFHVLQTEK